MKMSKNSPKCRALAWLAPKWTWLTFATIVTQTGHDQLHTIEAAIQLMYAMVPQNSYRYYAVPRSFRLDYQNSSWEITGPSSLILTPPSCLELQCSQFEPPTSKGLHSQVTPTIAKFCQLALKACDWAFISEHITAIKQLHSLLPADHQVLDEIDNDLTQCLVRANQHCQKLNDSPWFPALHTMYLEHRYWSVELTVAETKWPHTQALQNIRAHLSTEATTLLPRETISIHLRKIHWKLYTIRKEALENEGNF